jgi:hypothetical protein
VSSEVHDRTRGDLAQRWASILAGAAVLFVVSWMTLEATSPSRAIKKDLDAAAPTSSASVTAASRPTDSGADEPDAGLSLTSLGTGLGTSFGFGDASVMPSGAPRHVKIGVVLLTFAGAEGAPPTARSKREALAMAERLGQDARSDFHHAVTGGDPGSADDIGRLPRGVLDPRTEVAVFALSTGEVSDVLETPRGYWIVKRNE